MRSDNNLTKGVVLAGRFRHINRQIPQQIDHFRHFCRVNAVLWFFDAENSTSFWVFGQN